MRVECEACRELVVASFAVEGGAVRAHCPVCQHVTSASLGPPRGAASIGEPCPKCGAARKPDAPACTACGLTVARMAAYVAARDGAVPESLRDAWQRASDAWTDDAKHDELLRLVAAHDAYAWAAGRYRTRGKDAMATRQLDRLRRAAEATLLAGATVRPGAESTPYRASSAVLGMLVVAVAAGLLYAIVVRSPRAPTHAPAPTAPAPVRPLTPGHPVSPSTINAPPAAPDAPQPPRSSGT